MDIPREVIDQDVYACLSQFIASHDRLMDMFSLITSKQIEMQQDIDEMQRFIEEKLTEAVTGRNLYKSLSIRHKANAEALQVQLELANERGKVRVEMELPLAVPKGKEINKSEINDE